MKNYLTRKDDFGFNIFDDMFDNFFTPSFYSSRKDMRTDIKETEKGYELSVDMPGFEKKDISVKLENGYLTVSAVKEEKEENKDKYVKRERNISCSRSYYIGDGVTEDDIKAKYNNGILILDVPKAEQKQISQKHIEIE